MNKKPMKLYIVYDIPGGSPEGACLVIAYTAKKAKNIGYPIIRDWFDTEWVDMGVRLLKEHTDYLIRAEVNEDLFKKGIPHVIDNPKCCPNCENWGGGEIIDGKCYYCRED